MVFPNQRQILNIIEKSEFSKAMGSYHNDGSQPLLHKQICVSMYIDMYQICLGWRLVVESTKLLGGP